jgi:hypothetical protein
MKNSFNNVLYCNTQLFCIGDVFDFGISIIIIDLTDFGHFLTGWTGSNSGRNLAQLVLVDNPTRSEELIPVTR